MKTRRFILFCAALLILGIGVYFWMNSAGKSGVPLPTFPTEGTGETAIYDFSTSFAFPVETQADVYHMAPGEQEKILAQAEQALAVKNLKDFLVPGDVGDFGQVYQLDAQDLTVTVDDRTGWWISATNDSAYEGLPGPIIPENLPAKGEAVDIAEAYIRENDLFPGDLGEPTVGYSTTGSGEEEQPMDISVMFTPQIAGKDVYGIYRLDLVIGDNGKIRDVYKQAGPVTLAQSVPLKTEKEVRDAVLHHPEAIFSTATGMASGVITQCELVYYVDGIPANGKIYACPVYLLTGTGEDSVTGTQQIFTIYMDAVKR